MSVQRRTAAANARIGLLFVAPAMLLFVAFRFIPFVSGFLLAFAQRNLGGDFRWVGLENFQKMLSDDLFWHAFRVTAIYTLLAVPLTMTLSTIMALLVRRAFRGVRFFRSIFFLPTITSLVLAGVIFIWVFSATGPLGRLGGLFGVEGSWLTNRTLALPAIAIVAAWSGFGYQMLVILARLKEIPREIEEAALVDMASPWQRFRHITLPQLKQVVFFLSVLSVAGSFQVFDAVYVMTQGGPANATYTLGFMLYDQAFRFFDFGYASAVAVALFVFVIFITIIQRLVMRGED